MTAQHNPSFPPGLIDRADSILLIIDLQAGFLDHLTPERREAIIDRCRFLVEVATRLGIPKFATVEDPAKNGMTTDYGVRKGFAKTFHPKRTKDDLPTPSAVAKRAERWRPYRTVASWYMWRALELE